jgi:nitrite reductase/ring-hydroxylating ferredoxin subunit
MGVGYKAVLWNNQKRVYDRILWLGIMLFLITYIVAQLILRPEITIETLIIRATALCAFTLLHFILSIGPLARINTRFLPLLYNRRHAGVSMFLIAAIHGIFSIIQFHSLGDKNPLISLFTSNQKYLEVSRFPFQTIGFLALLILFAMAATSHDFWLKNLSPKIWKSLHMLVYIAYGLVVIHVATGAFQYESNPGNWILLGLGFILISGLQLVAGIKEVRQLKINQKELNEKGYYKIGSIEDIPNNRAKIVFINGENIAIFRYDGKISAVHNVCKHQMGPLGEGKIIDGCITCPWHGYQYLPENGQSPPPFKEKIKTFQVQVLKGDVWVNPSSMGEGEFVQAARIKTDEE